MSTADKPKQILQDILFCVTVNNSAQEHDDDPDLNDSAVSYNDLKRMICELGGRLSPTVHKNVDYLVASDTAVNAATQRVRKAAKYGIPVLKVEFIESCYGMRGKRGVERIDATEFTYDNIDEVVKSYEKTEKAARKGDSSTDSTKKRKTADEGAGQSYMDRLGGTAHTFECSCICHDRGEDGCSYCEGAHAAAAVKGRVEEMQGQKEEELEAKSVKKKKSKKRRRQDNDDECS